MTLLAIPFPNVDPVAFSLGPISVKWYGLAYMAGLLLGWTYVKRLLMTMRLWPPGGAPFSTEKTDDMLLFMTLGVVLGGRLGYVLFYNPAFYLANPAEIPAGLERRYVVPWRLPRRGGGDPLFRPSQ